MTIVLFYPTKPHQASRFCTAPLTQSRSRERQTSSSTFSQTTTPLWLRMAILFYSKIRFFSFFFRKFCHGRIAVITHELVTFTYSRIDLINPCGQPINNWKPVFQSLLHLTFYHKYHAIEAWFLRVRIFILSILHMMYHIKVHQNCENNQFL